MKLIRTVAIAVLASIVPMLAPGTASAVEPSSIAPMQSFAAEGGDYRNGCTFSLDSSWLTDPTKGLVYRFDFKSACNSHDDCYAKPHQYGDSESGRERCDKDFRTAMRETCTSSYGRWDPRRNICYDSAYLYYQAVRKLGEPWYTDDNTRF